MLVLDTSVNGDQDTLYQRLVAPDGPFKIVFSDRGIVVARRKPGI